MKMLGNNNYDFDGCLDNPLLPKVFPDNYMLLKKVVQLTIPAIRVFCDYSTFSHDWTIPIKCKAFTGLDVVWLLSCSLQVDHRPAHL